MEALKALSRVHQQQYANPPVQNDPWEDYLQEAQGAGPEMVDEGFAPEDADTNPALDALKRLRDINAAAASAAANQTYE